MANNFPDWTGTWADVKGFPGKTPWFTDNWAKLIDRVEDIADVINTATGRYTTLNDRHVAHAATTTEVVAARDGFASLLLKEQAQDTNIATRVSNTTGLTQNLSGNSYRGVSFANAVDPQDITTLSQVNSLIVGGGSPGDIPITSLGIGTATANQKIKVNGTGDAIIGVDDVQDITGLDVGTATANQKIKVNGTGDAIIGVDDITAITDATVGTATANQIISINGTGDAVVGVSRSQIPLTNFGGVTTNQYILTTNGTTPVWMSRYGIAITELSGVTTNQNLLTSNGANPQWIARNGIPLTHFGGVTANQNLLTSNGTTPVWIARNGINITEFGSSTLGSGETAKRSENSNILVRNQRTYGSRFRDGQYSTSTTATGVETLYLQNITTTTSTSLGLTYLSTPGVYVFSTTISGIYLISIDFSIQYYHDSQNTNYITATTYLLSSPGESTKNLIKWNGVTLPVATYSQTQNVSLSLICCNIASDAPSMSFGAYIQVNVGGFAGTKYIIIEDLKFQVIKVN